MIIKTTELKRSFEVGSETVEAIKGINLEGLRIIGSPNEYAKKYYQQGIDELIFIHFG